MRALVAGVIVSVLCAAPAAAQMPRATITGGPSGEVTETTATFTFEASGPAPLASFECRLDGADWAACQSPRTYEKLTGGPHVFQVRLRGPLTDPTPDERRWVIARQTEVTPPVIDPPKPPDPPQPPPPREDRRRDARGCAYAGNRPGEVLDRLLETATICVINGERRRRSLRALRHNASLQLAASRHTADMVRRRYFSHVAPDGRTLRQRVAATGYLEGARYWTIAEVLAWSGRPGFTPAQTVRAWMRSRPHKRALLMTSVRRIGVGITHGVPVGGGGGATWAANMGSRH